jgi:leucyl/phenylalanyl-tRNA---protein transferase
MDMGLRTQIISVQIICIACGKIGGLYGVTLGKCFFGESMFSLVPNASKLALIYLAQTFQELGGTLIDCQFETPHLKSMGGRYIDYEEYMRYVQEPLESL